MTSLLKVTDLSVEYRVDGRKDPILALDDASLDLPEAGYTLGIVGESGSGKTTLGMSIMRLIDRPGRITGGRVEYMGADVLKMNDEELRRFRWKEVAMVYQSAMNSLNPVKSVSQPIVEVLQTHTKVPRSEAREKALQLLSEVGIRRDRADDFPFELSGGMRQRVVIALALALSPKLLIADEPTSALDVVVQKQILELLRREMKSKGLSLIFITHDISILSELVQNVAVMYAGEIVERGPHDKVLFDPLHPYTEALLRSLVSLDSKTDIDRDDAAPPGRALSLDDAGENYCKYVRSCRYAFERCVKERPVLTETENGRFVACHKYS
jgi:oligopeptide/dipeptide ABC transporter ATP-binding protein